MQEIGKGEGSDTPRAANASESRSRGKTRDGKEKKTLTRRGGLKRWGRRVGTYLGVEREERVYY